MIGGQLHGRVSCVVVVGRERIDNGWQGGHVGGNPMGGSLLGMVHVPVVKCFQMWLCYCGHCTF